MWSTFYLLRTNLFNGTLDGFFHSLTIVKNHPIFADVTYTFSFGLHFLPNCFYHIGKIEMIPNPWCQICWQSCCCVDFSHGFVHMIGKDIQMIFLLIWWKYSKCLPNDDHPLTKFPNESVDKASDPTTYTNFSSMTATLDRHIHGISNPWTGSIWLHHFWWNKYIGDVQSLYSKEVIHLNIENCLNGWDWHTARLYFCPMTYLLPETSRVPIYTNFQAGMIKTRPQESYSSGRQS